MKPSLGASSAAGAGVSGSANSEDTMSKVPGALCNGLIALALLTGDGGVYVVNEAAHRET